MSLHADEPAWLMRCVLRQLHFGCCNCGNQWWKKKEKEAESIQPILKRFVPSFTELCEGCYGSSSFG